MRVVVPAIDSFAEVSSLPARPRTPVAQRLATWLIAATIAWGSLAFGAVYPWAYWVLVPMALLAGAMSVASSFNRTLSEASGSFGFIIALTAVGAVIALQLVPIPGPALTALNPHAVDLLHRLDPAFALNPDAHALSVWPQGTALALVLFGAFAVLLLSTARLLSITGARRLAELLIIAGVMLALVGIVQKPLYAGKIYGFWTSQDGGSPFGPFVNRNHFAGWMLMVLPVALGYLFASLARAMRGVRPEWHYRILWLSSPDASKLMLVAMSIGIMGIALVLTMSRSGIGALALALGLSGWFALRRLQGRSRKMLAGGYLVLLVILVVGLAGAEMFVTRFSESSWDQFNGRTGAWADAVSTFTRHWLTGTGVNTYQTVNLIYQQHNTKAFFSAAHNDYLQLAAEGGLFLIVAVSSCILLFLRDVRRRFAEDRDSSSYWLRAGAVTGLIAIALQEAVEFSLQMPGNAALFAVVCGIALHKTPGRRPSAPVIFTGPRRIK